MELIDGKEQCGVCRWRRTVWSCGVDGEEQCGVVG